MADDAAGFGYFKNFGKTHRQGIELGQRIPLIPRQTVKAGVNLDPNAQWVFDLDAVAVSDAYARGNENNAHAPDGVTSFGPDRSAGYAVFNLGGSYTPAKGLRFFARINNLFDRRYATAAQLGSTGFGATGHFGACPFPANADGEYPLRGSTFFAPGAPRSVSVGLRYAFN